MGSASSTGSIKAKPKSNNTSKSLNDLSSGLGGIKPTVGWQRIWRREKQHVSLLAKKDTTIQQQLNFAQSWLHNHPSSIPESTNEHNSPLQNSLSENLISTIQYITIDRPSVKTVNNISKTVQVPDPLNIVEISDYVSLCTVRECWPNTAKRLLVAHRQVLQNGIPYFN